MTPYLERDGVTIFNGDARAVLAELPASSVQCCVTSPPYWGLRDYGTAQWEGGASDCDHKPDKAWVSDAGGLQRETVLKANEAKASRRSGNNCTKCGARRIDSQIGIEPTPRDYVESLVGVFREVRRVLRDDGTLWLNLGDSYAGSWGNYAGGDRGAGKQRLIKHGSSAQNPVWDGLEGWRPPASFKQDGLKPKDLVGIPWRVAFALQEDGWYLRQDIIWAKPNPMPESVEDRCTKAHEYLFLLAKSERYYYDQQAILEAATSESGGACFGKVNQDGPGSRRLSDDDNDQIRNGTRNKRSVWTVMPASFKGAHFAVFPPALIEPCILAGCPEGGIVLDPFLGSGTTAAVAQQLLRKCIGCELNIEYCAMSAKRFRQRRLIQAHSS